MLTDEYVVVVDQLRSSQASLAAEQRRVVDHRLWQRDLHQRASLRARRPDVHCRSLPL